MFQRIRLLWSFLKIIKDPTQTEKILAVGNYKSLASKKSFIVPLQRIGQNYKASQFLREKWSPREYDIADLLKLEAHSFGFQHACHMMNNDLDPQFYGKVSAKDEIGYIRKRARQTHDFYHTLTGFDTSPSGEAGVIAFTSAQYGGAYTFLLLGLLLLHYALYKPGQGPQCLENIVQGYSMGRRAQFLFPVKFEELFHMNLETLRKELGISISPEDEKKVQVNYRKYPSLPFQSYQDPGVEFLEPSDGKEQGSSPNI